MERLTERAENCPDPKEIYGVSVKNHDYVAVAHRLAAYEDTEREPEEITAMQRTLDEYHKVADPLLRAQADGRLVVLPVRPVLTQSIGSMLYIIDEGEIVEDSLCEALIGMGSNGEINIFYTTLSDQISFEQADIGKTVFLAREEAEKALEAMKDE